MGPNEVQGSLEFCSTVAGMEHRDIRKREDRDERGKKSGEEVDPEHHLLSRDLVSGKDFVLGRVRGTVDEQVDKEVGDTNHLC